MTLKKPPFFFYRNSTSLYARKRRVEALRAADRQRLVYSVALWFVIPANVLAFLSGLGEYGNLAFQYICSSIPNNSGTVFGYGSLYFLLFWGHHKWQKYGCYLQLDHWPVSISDIKIHIGVPLFAPVSPPPPPPIIPVVRSGAEFESLMREKLLQDLPLLREEKIAFLLSEDKLAYLRNKELYDFLTSDSIEDRPDMWDRFFSDESFSTPFYKEYMGEFASRIPYPSEETIMLRKMNPFPMDEQFIAVGNVYIQGVHTAKIPITTGVRPFVEISSQGIHFNLLEIHVSAKVEWHLTDCISFWSWWNLPYNMPATKRQFDLQEAFTAFFHIVRTPSTVPPPPDEEMTSPVEMFYSTLSTFDWIRNFLRGATILVASVPPPT